MKDYDDPMEMREDFSALLDGELSAEEREALEARLGDSAESLRELEAFRRVDALYRGLDEPEVPADFEARLQEAIHGPKASVTPWSGGAQQWRIPLALAAGVLMVLSLSIGIQTLKPEPIRIAKTEPAADTALMAQAESAPARGRMEGFEADAAVSAAPPTPEPSENVAGLSAESRQRADDFADSVEDRDMQQAAKSAEEKEEGSGQPADEVQNAPEESTMRKQSAVAADVMAEAPAEAAAAQQTFSLKEDVWVQDGYAEQTTTPLPRSDERLIGFADALPAIDDYLADPRARIFQVNGVWYWLAAEDDAP